MNPSGQLGGAERCLLDVMQSVRDERPSWAMTLVASRGGPLTARAQSLGFDTVVVEMPEQLAALGDSGVREGNVGIASLVGRIAGSVGGALAYRRRLRVELKRLHPDIVHTNGYKMHIMGAMTPASGAALVWHLHDYASSRPLMGTAIKLFSRRCDTAFAVSESVAADIAPLWRGATALHVLLNAVDLDEFAVDGARCDLDAASGLPPAPPGTVRVGLVATMGRFKGHDVFLRALAKLPRSLPVRGYVVGGALYETRGSEWSRETLQRLVAALGLDHRVGFTGFVERPAEAIRSLDVVVHATTGREPFGLVIAEGMACGRAVITSGAGGAGEIIEPEVDSLVHAPGDPDSLARQIDRLVRDAGLRARLGRTAREHAEARFRRERLGKSVAPVYEQLAGRRAGGAVR